MNKVGNVNNLLASFANNECNVPPMCSLSYIYVSHLF
jgi:hypothetical protein